MHIYEIEVQKEEQKIFTPFRARPHWYLILFVPYYKLHTPQKY